MPPHCGLHSPAPNPRYSNGQPRRTEFAARRVSLCGCSSTVRVDSVPRLQGKDGGGVMEDQIYFKVDLVFPESWLTCGALVE